MFSVVEFFFKKDKGPLGVCTYVLTGLDFCTKSIIARYLGTHLSFFFHLTLTVFQIGRQKVSKSDF